jgi:hypothetical protein
VGIPVEVVEDEGHSPDIANPEMEAFPVEVDFPEVQILAEMTMLLDDD